MYKLGFIGMGNMASAILLGGLNCGYIKQEEVVVFDINPLQYERLQPYTIHSVKSEEELVENAEMIFMGVKPYYLEDVLVKIKDQLKDKSIVSFVSGYPYERYQALLDESTRHIMVMPNTPVLVNEGMSLIENQHNLKEDEYEYVVGLFNALGETEVMASHLMSVAGSVSGCAPAYIYMAIEAIADGGVHEGLPRDLAYKLASQMVMGSGKMAKVTKLHPGILKDQVCSPKGITIQGVRKLEEKGLRSALTEAIIVGAKRS